MKIVYNAVRLAFGISLVAYRLRVALIVGIFLALALYNPWLAIAVTGTTVLTNLGKEIIVDRLMGAGTEPKWVHWGTGAGAAAATNTDLSTPSPDEARVSGTSSKVTVTTADDTFQVAGTIICAVGGKTITNAGLFDAVSAGNMFVQVDSLSTVLAVDDGIAFTFKVKFA